MRLYSYSNMGTVLVDNVLPFLEALGVKRTDLWVSPPSLHDPLYVLPTCHISPTSDQNPSQRCSIDNEPHLGLINGYVAITKP